MKRKVAVGAMAGAITIILVWCLKRFAEVELPTEVAGSAQLLISTFVSWAVPDDIEE